MLSIGKLKSRAILKWQMGLNLVVLILLTFTQTWGFAVGQIKLASIQAEPGKVIYYFTYLLLRYMELGLYFVLNSAVKKGNLRLFRIWWWVRTGIHILLCALIVANEFLKFNEAQSEHPQEFGNLWMCTNILFSWIWKCYVVLDMFFLPHHVMELEVPNGNGNESWTLYQSVPFKQIILIQCFFYLLPLLLYAFVCAFKIINFFVEDRRDYHLLVVYIFLTAISPTVLPMAFLLYKGVKREEVSKLILFYQIHVTLLYAFGFSAFFRRIFENRTHQTQPNSSPAVFLNLMVVYYCTNYVILHVFVVEFIIQIKVAKTLPHSLIAYERQDENKALKSLVSQNSEFFQKIAIPQTKVKICEEDKLGEGQFSNVYRAKRLPGGSSFQCFSSKCFPGKKYSQEVVAVKVLKHSSNHLHTEALLQELKILDGVGEHEHLLKFYGCCLWNNATKGKRVIAIVLEYCSLGTLQSYLTSLAESKIFVEKVDISELIRLSIEVSEGMSYLENKKVIHADLAARNVLLNSSKRVKITDFGMSLQLYYYQTYASLKADLFPWKSMAPEALTDLKFSSKSDVWSYGILLYEIFSLGGDPYSDLVWTSHFVQELISGLRPTKPKLGGEAIFEIMSDCCQLDPGMRPGFTKLSSRLSYFRTGIKPMTTGSGCV